MMDEGLLRAAALGGFWTALDVVASTGSTNADLLARAAADAAVPAGQVLVAEEQTAGRGRLGRTWTSVPGAALTFSVLLRPVTVPAERRGWLPLIAGVAVASAVRSVTGGAGSGGGASGGAASGGGGSGRGGSGGAVDAVLKWPNDVLVGERKLAGILAEQSPDGSAVVIGIGLNVATPADALPVSPQASRRRHCWSRALPRPVRHCCLRYCASLSPGTPRSRPTRIPRAPACLTPTARSASPWGSGCASSFRSAAS